MTRTPQARPRLGYMTTPRALACSSPGWVSFISAKWASFEPALTTCIVEHGISQKALQFAILGFEILQATQF